MDNIICDIVPSIHSENKLVIKGHLIVKDRFLIKFDRGQHNLKKVSGHNHATQVAQADIIRAISNIKEQVHQTYDKPAQIIQNTTSTLQQTIQQIHYSDFLAESQFIDDLVILDNLKKTLDRIDFLVKDSV
ncbi:6325_t:CDS:2, partial [Scutellospora calospora]